MKRYQYTNVGSLIKISLPPRYNSIETNIYGYSTTLTYRVDATRRVPSMYVSKSWKLDPNSAVHWARSVDETNGVG